MNSAQSQFFQRGSELLHCTLWIGNAHDPVDEEERVSEKVEVSGILQDGRDIMGERAWPTERVILGHQNLAVLSVPTPRPGLVRPANEEREIWGAH